MKLLPAQATPSRGLLADYVAFATPLTDAPQTYHLAVGLAVFAALLGNRVSIPFGPRPLFPNLFVALLGRSTFSRKTTSIAIGQRLLTHFEGQLVLPSEFSPESFLERLEKSPTGLLIYPEFSRALAAFRRDYMVGMLERLTELYDCPSLYTRELRGKSFRIEQPVISIVAASTVEWLTKTMVEDDVRGGFYPRFMFILEGPRTQSLALPPEPEAQKEAQLVRGLSRLVRLKGKADLSRVRDSYEHWYRRLVSTVYSQDDSEARSAFSGRLSVTAIKLALMYHVAEADDLVISPEALERALALTEWLQQAADWLIGEGLTFSRFDKDRKRVLGLIRRRPGTVHSAALKASHLPARSFKEIIGTLAEEGSIVCQPNDGVTHYYPVA